VRTTTRYIRLNDWDSDEAAIVLRFMVIANDIVMTDKLRGLVRSKNSEFEVEGADHYLMRLAASQVFEALSILPELSTNDTMRIILNRNKKANEAFNRLLEYKSNGKFKKSWSVLRNIRNQGMFHYRFVGKWLAEYAEKRVRDGFRIGKIEWGDQKPTRFLVADDVYQAVFTYKILEHHDGKNFDEALAESVKILTDAQLDFATLAVAVILSGIENRYC